MMDEIIKGVCEEKHKNIDKKLEEHDKQMQQHEASLALLNVNITKLTAIVELLTSAEYRKSFWESESGKKILNALIIALLAIVGVAIGVNLLK